MQLKNPPKAKLLHATNKAGSEVPVLHLEAPLPPSDNHVYFVKRHRKILTKEGKKYKNDIAESVARAFMENPDVSFNPNEWHELILFVYFEKLETKGWYKTGTKEGNRAASKRFFKADTDNRRKIVIDAVCDAIGIDDSCLKRKYDEKLEGEPKVSVILRQCTDAYLAPSITK